MDEVTIVVSTYNRPQALVCALEGVRWQTHRHWRILVIGDCCGPGFGGLVKDFGDPRIRYINLKQRFGEQSGPNSVGGALADTPYIAFLNHDDLWMPDHLAHAIEALGSNRAGLFTGRAAFAIADPAQPGRAIFSEVSPGQRRLREAFGSPFYLFEPISAWVMTRQAARRVGQWRAAAGLYRTPLADWILRAWRRRVSHVDSTRVTVLKNNVHFPSRGHQHHQYDEDCSVLATWRDRLEQAGVNTFYHHIEQDLEEARNRGLNRDFMTHTGPEHLAESIRACLTPVTAGIFRCTGWDAMSLACQRAELDRGWLLRQRLMHRTGEALPEPPDFQTTLRDARAQLRRLTLSSNSRP